MRSFIFPAWCKFGKCENGESFVSMEFSDEDGYRIALYSSDEDTYYEGFSKCEQLLDLYEIVLNAADKQITEELIEEGILKEGTKASEIYQIGVEFPEELAP